MSAGLPGRRRPASGIVGTDRMFTVELKPSGHRFKVTEDDVILDMALKQGFRMPYGCRAGTCKSCRAKVMSGEVDVGRAFPAPSFMLRARQAGGFTLMCRATAKSDLVIEVDEQPDLPDVLRYSAQVAEVDYVGTDVAILRLRLTEGLLSFVAGQFVDLLLPDGVRRSYSIADSPAATGRETVEFHIRHMPGGLFTDRLFGRSLVGETIEIEAPLGSFYLREAVKPVIMLASGTGYAPIRSILLDTLPRSLDREFVLYWGARRPADIYRMEEAAELASTYPNFSFVPVLSEAREEDRWTGRQGLVHRAVMEDYASLAGFQVYACGVPAMVNAAFADFSAHRELPETEFFADAFVTQSDLAGSV